LHGANGEDGAKNRSDAWRPSEAKGNSNQESARRVVAAMGKTFSVYSSRRSAV